MCVRRWSTSEGISCYFDTEEHLETPWCMSQPPGQASLVDGLHFQRKHAGSIVRTRSKESRGRFLGSLEWFVRIAWKSKERKTTRVVWLECARERFFTHIIVYISRLAGNKLRMYIAIWSFEEGFNPVGWSSYLPRNFGGQMFSLSKSPMTIELLVCACVHVCSWEVQQGITVGSSQCCDFPSKMGGEIWI